MTEDAPAVYESLCGECRDHFDMVKAGLDGTGTPYRLDKRLVRGLDYYTKTAYEVLSGALGSQNAVCGGGRYDNLAEAIGGPHVPGVGFAAGVDRILMVMEQQGCSFGAEPALDVYGIAMDRDSRAGILHLLDLLRRNGISADMDFSERSMKAQMKSASARKARLACILGENELERGTVTVKDLNSGEQKEISADSIVEEVQKILSAGKD